MAPLKSNRVAHQGVRFQDEVVKEWSDGSYCVADPVERRLASNLESVEKRGQIACVTPELARVAYGLRLLDTCGPRSVVEERRRRKRGEAIQTHLGEFVRRVHALDRTVASSSSTAHPWGQGTGAPNSLFAFD